MLKIGILGKFNEISNLIEKICSNLKISTILFQINNDLKNFKITPNILVFNTFPKNFHNLKIPPNCIILLNIDKLNSYINFKENYVITYGFNENSNITISSTNNTDKILFCIQNNLKSILGKTIYQQEFTVNYKSKNIYSILVATTIGILFDFEPENFKKVF